MVTVPYTKLLKIASNHITPCIRLIHLLKIAYSLFKRCKHNSIALFFFLIKIDVIAFLLNNNLRILHINIYRLSCTTKLYRTLHFYLVP